MADRSKIEWTDATWNPIRGCSVVSEGCRNCYAMNFAARFSGRDKIGDVLPYNGFAYRNETGAHWTGEVQLIEEHLEDPLRWKRPRRIFVNSMSDLFHESLPDEWISKIFAVMALAPQHTFQVLTKRPERAARYFYGSTLDEKTNNLSQDEIRAYGDRRAAAIDSRMDEIGHQSYECFGKMLSGDATTEDFVQFDLPLLNVQILTSIENQLTANERIPWLLRIPAALLGLSIEPLLGPIDLGEAHPCGYYCDPDDEGGGHHDHDFITPQINTRIGWVIVGGESGPASKTRPMHPNWVRSLRDQCVAAGVPFFFKQWGTLMPDGIITIGDEVIPGTSVYDKHGERVFPDCCSNDYDVDPHDDAIRFHPLGKKAAGRLLDGREWNEYPDATLGGA